MANCINVLINALLNRAPTIIIQPDSSVIVDQNKPLILSCVALGQPTMRYQWYKDGVAVDREHGNINARSPVYIVCKSALVDAGVYTCVVTNSYGSVTSSSCTVTIKVAPVILVQPVNTVINDGQTLTLSVVAKNASNYQWYMGGVAIAGATSATYTKTGVVADTGEYYCKVWNAYGSVTSLTVSVTVKNLSVAPTIIVQPQSQSIPFGTSFSLSVVANGTEPLAYQWKKDGGNIPGATSATYTDSDMQIGDAGSYTCVVTNVVGNVTSDAAVIEVIGFAPEITSITLANGVVALPGLPIDSYYTGIDIGMTLSITVTTTGSGANTYEWYIDQVGTQYDTGAGQVLIGDQTSATLLIPNAQTVNAGTYYCKITNAFGNTKTDPGLRSNVGHIVMIRLQPVDVTVDERQSSSLSCGANGTSIKYQWYKDGLPIGPFVYSGQNYDGIQLPYWSENAEVYRPSSEVTDAGSYTCKIVSCLPSGELPPDPVFVWTTAAHLFVTEIGFVPEITEQPQSVQIPPPGLVYDGNLKAVANPGQNGQNNSYYETGSCVMDMSDDGQYQIVLNNERYAYISSDFGTTWAKKWHGNWNTKSVSMSADGMYLSSFSNEGRGSFTSSDYGTTWVLRTNAVSNPYSRASSMDHSGQYRLIQCWNDASAGAWLSKNYGVTWTKVLTTGGWGSTAISGNGQYMFVAVAGTGIWSSPDYGTTWTKIQTDSGQTRSIAVSYTGQYILWGLYGSKIYSSANYGISGWHGDGAPIGNYRRLVISNDGKIRAGIATENATSPIYYSRDFGVTYIALPNSTGKGWTDIAMSGDGNRLTGVLPDGSIWVFTVIENISSFAFDIKAIGTPPLSYQWYKESVLIPDATNFYYGKDVALVGDIGSYNCIAMNNYGSAISDSATLSVGGGAPA